LEDQEKGRKAAIAIGHIKRLLEWPSADMDLEIYRPEGIDSSIDADAQIVDCLVRLAIEQHPDDRIEFITDDDGLPTVLFIQEKKHHELKHVTRKT
jgi:hypothetical protein